jgi:hypothetical protein
MFRASFRLNLSITFPSGYFKRLEFWGRSW